MRIVLFVVNDGNFVPLLNEQLVKEKGNQIIKIYVSKSLFSIKKLIKSTPFFLRNLYPFCIKPTDLIKFSIQNTFKKKKNAYEYFKSKGFEVEYIDTLNSESFRLELKKLKPDIFLFSPFDKIAGPKFLNIPNIGSFNIHLGKLPEYKGGLSAFWVLRFGDPIAGVSIHRINNKIDEGELVAEHRFNVTTNSMHELMLITVYHGSKLIVDLVNMIEKGNNINPIDKKMREENYFFYPKAKDFFQFYKKKNKLI